MIDLGDLAVDKEVTTPAGDTYRVRVEQDPDTCDSPRDYDGKVAVIVTETDRDGPKEDDGSVREALGMPYSAQKVVARWLRICHGATVVLPVYSGSDGALLPGRTDELVWGGLGVAYDTPETRAHLGDNPSAADVEAAIRGEVEEYGKWATGEVYGYVVERKGTPCEHCDHDPEWETVNSCWGYIGYEYAVSEAIAALRLDLRAEPSATSDESIARGELRDELLLRAGFPDTDGGLIALREFLTNTKGVPEGNEGS